MIRVTRVTRVLRVRVPKVIRGIKVTGVNKGENGHSSYRSKYVEEPDYVDGDRHGVIGPITVIRVKRVNGVS